MEIVWCTFTIAIQESLNCHVGTINNGQDGSVSAKEWSAISKRLGEFWRLCDEDGITLIAGEAEAGTTAFSWEIRESDGAEYHESGGM
jgi:hypothetical protein